MKNTDTSKLNTLRVLGGEPFYSKSSIRFLESLADYDLSNITFKTNTNASIFPDRLIPILERFKHFELTISLDGVEEVAEYARYGTDWNTIKEVRLGSDKPGRNSGVSGYAGTRSEIRRLSEVDLVQMARISTGLTEFDRVLGGGIVRGSVVLIGGSPGAGKSTILLQAVANIAARDISILYVSGEESLQQILFACSLELAEAVQYVGIKRGRSRPDFGCRLRLHAFSLMERIEITFLGRLLHGSVPR